MNVENLVRSGVILVVSLPITLGVAVSGLKNTNTADTIAVAEARADLVDECLDYVVSKADSKLERQAQDAIDKKLGSDGADYKSLCSWVLR